MATSANHNNDNNNTRTHMKQALQDAMLQAMAPLVIEGMGLLTDAVRELREQLKDDSLQRRDCAPLRRQLQVKRLQASLEDFDIDRAEEKAERDERKAERKMGAIEREERKDQILANRNEREARLRKDVNGYDHDSDSEHNFL